MATNPNVPASQEAAAKSSAPDAKVIGTQPAQQSAATPVNGGAAQAAATGVPSTGTPSKGVAMKSKDVNVDRDDQIDDEQKVIKDLNKKNEGADYFEKVANDDKVFNDQYREQARLEREAEAEAGKGDPTRDPVAKQAAMDMNGVQPGAQAEAEKMRKF